MPMPEIGGLQRVPDSAALQRQGLHEAHEVGMGRHASGRATLIRAMTNNDMRADGALGVVVVHRHARHLQAGQELMMMLQDAARQKGEGVWSYETIP